MPAAVKDIVELLQVTEPSRQNLMAAGRCAAQNAEAFVARRVGDDVDRLPQLVDHHQAPGAHHARRRAGAGAVVACVGGAEAMTSGQPFGDGYQPRATLGTWSDLLFAMDGQSVKALR